MPGCSSCIPSEWHWCMAGKAYQRRQYSLWQAENVGLASQLQTDAEISDTRVASVLLGPGMPNAGRAVPQLPATDAMWS